MISVHESENLSLQEIEQFLLAATEVRFEASQREEVYGVYGWVEGLLRQQEFGRQGRRVRGLLRRYVGKMTGFSFSQVVRQSVYETALQCCRQIAHNGTLPSQNP
jgi:hypothetical protein